MGAIGMNRAMIGATAKSSRATLLSSRQDETHDPSLRLLCFPGVQQLDLTGPYEIFASARGAVVHLVWKDLEPVRSATGLMLTPDTVMAEAPDFDVLCIPGGSGVNGLLADETSSPSFKIRRKGRGSSLLSATLAGPRKGWAPPGQARCHALERDGLLPALGAIPVAERVVQDGSIITAGGVTSGIDFGLASSLSSRTRGGRDDPTLARIPPLRPSMPALLRPPRMPSSRRQDPHGGLPPGARSPSG